MKKVLQNFMLIIAFLFSSGMLSLTAQPLMIEDFDYPIGALLTANGWTAHSAGGTQPIDVTNGLSFTGYPGSNIGGAANLDNTGEDDNKTFPAQTEGTIYAAFLMQTQSTNAAGYFLHFGQASMGTTFFTRVWVNSTGDGVGIGTSVSAYVPISVDVPWLIAIKYDVATKVSSLYVFNSMPSEEPAAPNATFTETGTYTGVGSIGLRQYNASQRILVDGIRIATNWTDLMGEGLSQVSTPTFNPPAGTYSTPQMVTISCATEGASIYYTTDGSDPSMSSNQYFNPIEVATTTTIKAIAYLDGMNPSNIASATYTFQVLTPVATLAELRAQPTGATIYQLTGEAVLTFKQTFRNQKYIQDATAAILIDDLGGKITTVYNVGDGITGMKGTLAEFGGMLQFTPTEDPGTATSTGNTIAPQEITLTEYNNNFELYESELVKINAVTFANGGQNFVNGIVYAISDASADATANFRTTFYDVNYIGTLIPNYEVNIVAIPNSRTEGNFLTSRNLEDITPTSTTPTLIVTSPNGGELWEQGTTHNITWQSLNFTGNVKIELTGLLIPFVISASAPNTGTFSWNISPTQSTTPNYKVRISNAAGGGPTDLSDDFFHITAPLPEPEIVINEIHYNPATAQGVDTDYEFVELYNKGGYPTDLSGWTIPGISYNFPSGYILDAGAYVAICVKPSVITAYYGVTNVVGPYTGALNNSGELLLLKDNTGATMDSVHYLPTAPWPTAPNGQGPSLELINPTYDNSLATSWSASNTAAPQGTPGTQNSVYVSGGSITVTSQTHQVSYVQGSTAEITWNYNNITGNVKVELIYTDGSIEVIGTNIPVTDLSWNWNIPSDQTIADSLKIRVSEMEDGDPFDDCDGWVRIVAPVTLPGLVINEIMYNSIGSDNEWIEIYNNSNEAVDLEGYQVLDNNNNNPRITITAGHTIAAHGYFTIAIDSISGAAALTFTPDFNGRGMFALDNTSDQVRLFHSTGLLVDAVGYMDTPPWPVAPDGTGPSLSLLDPDLDNSLAENWAASNEAGGTPGAVNFSTVTPEITVTAPNGGEQWVAGQSYSIAWTPFAYTGNVTIEYFLNDTYVEIAGNIPAADASYTWAIPSGQTISDLYKIRISGTAGTPTDMSDNYFSVVAPPPPANIVITEIMYNPPESGTDSLEYIELYNAGAAAVNLYGWSFTQGVTFTFPDFVLNPGEYVVVAVKATALLNLFGVTAFQWNTGQALGNGGEAIELKNAAGEVMDYVNYDDIDPWPIAADDYGPSLVLCDPSMDNNVGSNWTTAVEFLAKNAAGKSIYGTPGAGCTLNDAQRINIQAGWSGISSYVIPLNANVSDLFNPVSNDLVILQNFSNVYWPELNVNTIGNWSTQKGYVIKTSTTAPIYTYLPVVGTTDADRTIELSAGWNLLPVASVCNVDATTLFSAFPEIVIVKDVAGVNVWWPETATYTLTTLTPGAAYFILVNAPVNITFPACSK